MQKKSCLIYLSLHSLWHLSIARTSCFLRDYYERRQEIHFPLGTFFLEYTKVELKLYTDLLVSEAYAGLHVLKPSLSKDALRPMAKPVIGFQASRRTLDHYYSRSGVKLWSLSPVHTEGHMGKQACPPELVDKARFPNEIAILRTLDSIFIASL